MYNKLTMLKHLVILILITSLLKSMKTQKIHRKTLTKENEDGSRQTKNYDRISEESNDNIIDDDSTNHEETNEDIGRKSLAKKPIEDKSKYSRHSKAKSSEIKLKILESRKGNKNSETDEDEDSNRDNSGQDTELIDDRPFVTTELTKTDLPDTEEAENLLIGSRPVQEELKDDEIETKPSLQDEVTIKSNDIMSISKRNSNLNKLEVSKIKQNKTKYLGQDKVHLYYTTVADNNFGYMAAILKSNKFLCAGALIDESWILTAANQIHLMRETIRFLRIRLGSTDFKKGGIVLPIMYFETHPYFNSSKPDYDLAMVMLSKPVRYTVNVRPIRIQLTPKDVSATHFMMTSWHSIAAGDIIKHRRILSVAHLHPSEPEDCLQELKGVGANHDGIMCLEGASENTCVRDTGAPLVMNGVLWGVISSWKPQECDDEASILATLVSGKNVSTWLHATIHGHKWHPE